jgi:hypothetical protein
VVECPNCGAEVRVESEPPLQGAPVDTLEGGWASAYIQTIKISLTKPTRFFEGIDKVDGYWRPLVFALINSMIVAVLVAAYQLGFQTIIAGANVAWTANVLEPMSTLLTAPLALMIVFAVIIIFVPVFTALGLLLTSAIYHLCLIILGAANRPFVQTFRVACYATGPQLLQILPVAGGMIAAIWQVVLTIMGLKIVHRTTYGRTILAVFLPLMICCSILVLFIAAVMGSVVAGVLATIQS